MVDTFKNVCALCCYLIKSDKTLMKWFHEFRDNQYFAIPDSSNTKRMLPPLLDANPDLIKTLINFCKENLNDLTIEALHCFTIKKALPDLVEIIKTEREEEYTIEGLLSDHGIKTLCINTMHDWMKKLGFNYSPRKKTYYVDTHESVENVAYRAKFIDRYFGYELLAHRWHSITKEERNEMVKTGQVSNDSGYKYYDVTLEMAMYEYHVDDHISFQKACDHLPFGGNLSIRKPVDKKQVMIIGQDEAIMKKNLFSMNAWSLPDGTRPLIPKDEGIGIMISAFTCRELGFGYTVPDDILERVNTVRLGQKYSDEKAATLINGTPFKKKLTKTPFVRELEYGCNRGGYWTYDHMSMQLEDCIDILKINYPEFDFIFLFDHSNGHDRLQPDGLSLNKISVKYGGKQPLMRKSQLTSPDLFGPFHNCTYPLQLGDYQSMQFSTNDLGPCYLNDTERVVKRYDKDTGKTRLKKSVKQVLISRLQGVGIKDPKGTRGELERMAKEHDLPVISEEKVIDEGWIGKPKGALQLLFERGWIDPTQIGSYTLKGKKISNVMTSRDENDTNFSISRLMQQQSDFKDEITLLQFHANLLGVTLDRTPKCHCEIAGEGIEYNWGFSKLAYRRAPIRLKRNKASFYKLVQTCLDNKGVLNIIRVRQCSKKARQYMLLYKAVKNIKLDEVDGIKTKEVLNKHSVLEESMKVYRKLKQKKTRHRSVREYDIHSLENEYKECQSEDSKEHLVLTLVKEMISN